MSVPGGIAATLASFDARTFRQPPDGWQPVPAKDKGAWFEGSADGLIGDLIRDGATGVSGQTGEAYVLGAFGPTSCFQHILPVLTSPKRSTWRSRFSAGRAWWLAIRCARLFAARV